MKKKLFIVLALVASLLMVPGVKSVEAGNTVSPNTAFTCTQTSAYQARICIDLSGNSINVYTTCGYLCNWSSPDYRELFTTPLYTGGGNVVPGLPYLPWFAWDSECNANTNLRTSFYHHSAAQWVQWDTFPGQTYHTWYNGTLSTNMRNIVAYVANLNGTASGIDAVECIIVP